MDSLASEDTLNAPGAVSDEMIHAENQQIEDQQQEAQGTPPHRVTALRQPLIPMRRCRRQLNPRGHKYHVAVRQAAAAGCARRPFCRERWTTERRRGHGRRRC
jgi:hypothetical protein